MKLSLPDLVAEARRVARVAAPGCGHDWYASAADLLVKSADAIEVALAASGTEPTQEQIAELHEIIRDEWYVKRLGMLEQWLAKLPTPSEAKP